MSRDDEKVPYYFQRPQPDADFQNYQPKNTRWAVGDDSMIDTMPHNDDLTNLPTFIGDPKKIWGSDDASPPSKQLPHGHPHGPDPKADMPFLGIDSQWNAGAWSGGQDHSISQPITMPVGRRSGSYPGGSEGPALLSPRSAETGGLGVKMVEEVLSSGLSPTNTSLNERMRYLSLNAGAGDSDNIAKRRGKAIGGGGDYKGGKSGASPNQNGMLPNGIDDDERAFSRAPGNHSDGIPELKMKPDAFPGSLAGPIPGAPFPDMPFPDDMGVNFFDYPTQPVPMPANMSEGSPSMAEYNQSMYQRQPNPLMAPQYPPLNQGQGQPGVPGPHGPGAQGGPNSFPQSPYIQDPYHMSQMIPPGVPPMMAAQYYGMPPWGMYPNMMGHGGQTGQPQGPPPHMQQQQQPMMPRGSGQRPLSPTGTNSAENGGTPGSMPGAGQYPMMPPHPNMYENGSLIMNPARRGMNPMPMMPGPMMMNPHPNQPNPNMRMMPNPGMMSQNPSGGQHKSLFNGANNGPSSIYNSNGNMGYGSSGSTNNFSNNTPAAANGGQFNFPPGNGQNYPSSSLGPIGPLNPSLNSPRRDSFDGRGRTDGTGLASGLFSSLDNYMGRGTRNQQFYGSGGIPPSPGPGSAGGPFQPPGGQSFTPPPPPMNGSGNLFGGRFGAAPGSDGRYGGMKSSGFSGANSGPGGGMIGSNHQMPTRIFGPRNSVDKGQPAVGRSRLLEDFRNNRYPNLTLNQLQDHIVEFSQDQHGSRFIQQKLERATPQEKQMVFNEIIGHALNLMTDVFGNYVIQKFFEFGTAEQKQALAQKVKGHVLQLALQMYGCRVIQKALESVPPEQQKEVVKELDGHVLKCVKDQNGNHVVQKCIECVEPKALQFIINAFQGQVYALSTHPYGCRVIQRILEHCTPEQTTPILEELHSNVENLVQDQYGNYVIQHVLERGRPEDKTKIINSVRGKILSLSQHKFASNVIEKCVTNSARTERAMIIEEICSYNDNSQTSALYLMMKDQYANYVVQKMIEVADAGQRKLLINRIRPHIPSLRKYTYGKHILAKLDKYFTPTPNSSSSSSSRNNNNNNNNNTNNNSTNNNANNTSANATSTNNNSASNSTSNISNSNANIPNSESSSTPASTGGPNSGGSVTSSNSQGGAGNSNANATNGGSSSERSQSTQSSSDRNGGSNSSNQSNQNGSL